jgi:hypothetical protein
MAWKSHSAIWNEELSVSTCVIAFKKLGQSSCWKQMAGLRVIGLITCGAPPCYMCQRWIEGQVVLSTTHDWLH